MKESAGARFVRLASRFTVAGAATVAALELARIVFRNHHLFCPVREPLASWDPAAYGLDPSRVDEVTFEAIDGSLLHGWYCRAQAPVASILYCHGNRGNLTMSAANIARLNEAGLNVFVFDYRGFGKSSGRPTLRGVILDAAAAAAHHDRIRPGHLPSILFGYSLGGAVAAQVLGYARFDGVVLQSTFTTLRDMAKFRFPKTPLHFVSGTDFDTLAIVKRITIPLLIIHGSNDEVIPSWMGDALVGACRTARIHRINGAMHTDLYDRDAAGIIAAIREFAVGLPRVAGSVQTFRPSISDRILRSIRKAAIARRLGLAPKIA